MRRSNERGARRCITQDVVPQGMDGELAPNSFSRSLLGGVVVQ